MQLIKDVWNPLFFKSYSDSSILFCFNDPEVKCDKICINAIDYSKSLHVLIVQKWFENNPWVGIPNKRNIG